MTERKERLLFKNPVFQDGVNATVRLGDKWVGRVVPDQVVELWETGKEPMLGYAVIVDRVHLKICDISEDLLAHEHDPKCRTHQGLIAELERVYRKKVSSRDRVVLILFERITDAEPA